MKQLGNNKTIQRVRDWYSEGWSLWPHDEAAVHASLGLAFLLQTRASIPKGCACRDFYPAMDGALRIAIDTRMRFRPEEGAIIASLESRSCAGCFYPMDGIWYARACRCGSSYAKAWEQAKKIEPWIAGAAAIPERGGKPGKPHRVAVGFSVLLPFHDPKQREAEPPANAPRIGRRFVWWISALDDESLILLRYRLAEEKQHWSTREGQPAKRWVVDRKAWAELWKGEEAE
jgi:hypothetical protein